MNSTLDDISELLEVRKQIKILHDEEDKILNRIEKRERYSIPEAERKFPSKIAAMEFLLRKSKIPLHSSVIAATLAKEYGFPLATSKTVGGMLRRYSSEGRIFRAEGGNRFTVLDK